MSILFCRFRHRPATLAGGLVALAATTCTPPPAETDSAGLAKRNLLENAALLTPALQSGFFRRDGSYVALVANPARTAADPSLQISGEFYTLYAYGSYPKNLLYLSSPAHGLTVAFPFMDEYSTLLANLDAASAPKPAGGSTQPTDDLEINRYLWLACHRLRIVGQRPHLARLMHLVADSLLGLKRVTSLQQFDRWVEMERPRDRSFGITRNRFLANCNNADVYYYRAFKGGGSLWECTVNVSPDSLPLHWRFLRRECFRVLGD